VIQTASCNDFEFQLQAQPKAKSQKSIQVRLLLTRPVAGEVDKSDLVFLTGFPIRPAAPLKARDWRHVRIKASSDALECLAFDDGRWVPFSVKRLGEPELTRTLQKKLALQVPEISAGGVTLPGWGPSGSLGLFVNRGQGSFRNVTITPIRHVLPTD
jgi:hypothetical protein